ncbi:MAG: type II toxin-antitoxin system prevent-host-death family antitoxin, partial [Halanaerobiales bacterium]
MLVSSTEVQNNFGHYLMMVAKEPITISKNGIPIAKLISLLDDTNEDVKDVVAENRLTSRYIYGGKEGSFEDFMELSEISDKRYEYIDGEIYFLASPSTIHQIILQELYIAFYDFFQGKDCKAMLAPYDISLQRGNSEKNIVQPDLMVICDLEEKLDDRDYYMGIPTLVVEVISKSTRSKDMVKKLDLYMKSAVEEYWIVDPYKKQILIYLFKDKEIEDFRTFRDSDIASS